MVHDRGLVPALVALWFNYAPGTWPDWKNEADRHPMNRDQAQRYGRYLAGRYGAFGSVWLVSGDTNYCEDDDKALAVYEAAAAAIADGVTHPLCTTHIVGGQATPDHVLEQGWVDFHLYQSSHVTDLERPVQLAETCASAGDRPVINGEPPYERHGYFDDPGREISRSTVRKAAWLSVFTGASAGVTYGGHGVWQWHRDGERFDGADRIGMPVNWERALEFPGSRDYGNLRRFLERFTWSSLQPAQELLVDPDPLVRAVRLPGDGLLLVYVAEPTTVELVSSVSPPISSQWIDPVSWRARNAAYDSNGGELVFSSHPWTGDGVLIITNC